MDNLSKKQKDVLNTIKKYIAINGYPPTVREIGTKLNLSSPATIQYYIELLEKKGYLKKVNSKTRTMELLVENEYIKKNTIAIPLINTDDINPIEKIKNKDKEILIPLSLSSKNSFALLIIDNKLNNIGFKTNDLVLIDKVPYKENDIVAVLINDKISLKLLKKNIEITNILGKAIGVYRTL